MDKSTLHIPSVPKNQTPAWSSDTSAQGDVLSEKYPLLSQIDSSSDLRRLPVSQLPQVCDELRGFIIQNLSSNPGHFASSMGAVEIITALHYVFDTPKDHIVYDVGHQAYAHKILTGRRDSFCTQRTLGGLSGFPNPLESEDDAFIAGHAGNSISAALGMAIADKTTPGHEERKTVAVIGDASISNGLAFEGLNNASNSPNDLLIILNDNEMSIDSNVGALHKYLSTITISAGYNKWRNKLYNYFRRKGLVNDRRKGRVLRFNNAMKALISGDQNIFEGLNIRYFGPFDGHDVQKVVKVLNDIKDMRGPRILHLRTVKGKGFASAEQDPTTWHAPGMFDPTTGERKGTKDPKAAPNWQEVMGRTLIELAETDDRVTAVTAAMPSGTSVGLMMARFPDRSYDVGISEGHAVTFAGGMASAGKRPFVAIYSSFLQRGYDNIIHDVAIQGLPVTFCIDRAGIVGEDGVTHHGLFDLAYLRCLPGLGIASPADEETLRNLMYSSLQDDAPLAIRYPRGKAITPNWHTPMRTVAKGRGRALAESAGRGALLTLGPIASEATAALKSLGSGASEISHYDMIWLKPLDEEIMAKLLEKDFVVTVEDGVVSGGFGSAVTEWLADHGYRGTVRRLGVPDKWVHQGKVGELRHLCGYDAESIRQVLEECLKSPGVK